MDNTDQIGREIRFEGLLDLLREDAPRFVASIRYHQYDPTVLDVELLWLGAEEQQRVGTQTLSYLARNHLWLHSNDPNVPPIELLGIHKTSVRGNRSAIDVTGINVGITEDELQEDLPLSVIVELQPSGILGMPGILQMSYTGEVKLDKMMSGEVSVETSFGTLQAMQRYEYTSSSDAFGNRVNHSIQRASITGRILIPAHTCMLDAHESLRHKFDDVCLALSLCYRQPVDYYEIKYIPAPQEKAERRRSSLLSRRKWLQHATKQGADDLINVRNLIDGGLQKLIMSIGGCSEYESVARAIRFLSASYEARLETAYLMGFAAMETVVDACVPPEERVLLSAAKWTKVQRKLRTTIESLGLGTVTAEMKSKIGELRRATLRSRIENACVRMAPKTDDLWTGQSVSQGIATAVLMRNELFHAALSADMEEMSNNLVRVRTFTERLLLKKLQWSDERIWNWYDQDLKRINAP